jgi:diaminohydroxyphosphoribosylaminopyrimidine deaminase/5-amino-6-(5-phosphoribosylamino)uracil reductase
VRSERFHSVSTGLPAAGTSARVSLARALQLAGEAAGRAYPKPTVGAVVMRDGEVVGEGVTEQGGPHAEVVALDAAGARARGATLFVTMEPCSHWGATPPCTDRVLADGVARVVVGARDPNPEAGGGIEVLRAAGVDVELLDSWEARVQTEAWRVWVAHGRPFVTYKVAVTLDGRVAVPGRRWVSGETSRRLVHELRAAADAVAVGMGTVRADAPRLDVRDVPTPRGQPRRLAFGKGPLPQGSELELRSGPLADELRSLAAEGVQSLLLEGGPTLAASFLDADLVDKLLIFTAPLLAGGSGPTFLPRLGSGGASTQRVLSHLSARAVGEDVLLEAYVHEP